jgi:hypothetical protein
MQDLAKWLEEPGMSEYTQRFAENDIDISVLPHLTDHDLKLRRAGERQRLIAVSKLSRNCLRSITFSVGEWI